MDNREKRSHPSQKIRLLLIFALLGIVLFVLYAGISAINLMVNTARCQGRSQIVVWSIKPTLLLSDKYREVICADGSGTVDRPLPRELANASRLAFSSDGNRVAFVSWSPDDLKDHISILNLDGSGLAQLSNAYIYEDEPAWSADGKRLAFHAYAADLPHSGIYVTDVSCLSGNIDCASSVTLLQYEGSSPTWSPDGKKIAFQLDTDPSDDFRPDIFVMNADGSNPTNLTQSEDRDFGPVWSPDGQQIAFASYEDKPKIYLINPDGSNLTYLTDGYQPAWSPDGRSIAFISVREGDDKRIPVIESSVPANALYLITRDGAQTIRLTLLDREHITEFAWLP
jgi:Tol biopolymer transport system component